MQRRPGPPARFPARLPGSDPPAPRPAAAAPAGAAGSAPSALTGLMRARMVQRLAAGGMASAPVLQAMGAVERHRFVDSALGNQAYEDISLPIGLGQTISKPQVVARMCELLLGAEVARAGGLGRVLEIGTGCGYQAAVLSFLAREVYTLERLRGLYDKARDRLRPLRLANVHLLFGDGMPGYAKGAPYAAIIAAAGGDAVPQAWCDQLAVGGRLVAPMALSGGPQMLLVIDKTLHGLEQSVLEPVHFVPLKSGIA
ncbi:protein-L-isoaspartate(D-aspartate) O-methyltransferase [Verminephrobacter eiseniae]|uniref:Protein-L-isoaspartate O-methyltransferase n=3 Tax=Verminephrobacter eiseniae TaxID=364317 RepID=A1WE25_VEREI|nr:protein-L-isoaspartate(D-aspartate) O-methyltransferase [Verminephrobacter eiseniae]ABM55882.1 protein-L-isoaspartate O-methyltransferase [Verminephrobacter eiseniae EF01-2]MCW5286263.1 protein-L-isoaspartate(D-aspartate) O-methyltransferase [Verminephrobacter eiseniae]MCW5304562.1 protein-L-isoaspartate(D-aspartate) O-methyltransferase [Verminephrobacter eiseniae]